MVKVPDQFQKKKILNKIIKRKKDAHKAAKILGIKKIFFLDLLDNKLDSYPLLKIVKIVEEYIFQIKPNIIFTHFKNDLNIDHQIVNNAVVTACRPQKNNTVKCIFFFEVPSSTEWKVNSKSENFNPNWFEDISKTENLKIKAIKAYKSELKKWPHPRSEKAIKALIQWRGATAGLEAAEAFVLARNIK